MQRRRLLQTIAAGTSLAIAGCVGGGDEEERNTATSSSESETGEPTDDGSTPTDESTADPTDQESDDSPGQKEDEETTDQTEEESDEETAEESEEETAEPTLGSLGVDFEDNYRFSVSIPQMGAPVTGAFNGGNFYSVVTVQGDSVTTYIVDGQQYVVADGSCTPVSGGASSGMDVSSLADADSVERDVTAPELASLTPSGSTTIDGTRTYVYELASQGASVTYYIGVESQRLRRVETQQTVIDYTDWGAVDPITAPC